MIQYQNMVDIFYAVKTLRNCKPNMVESLVRERERKEIENRLLYLFTLIKKKNECFPQDQYRFCYDLVLEYLDCFDDR